jgi:hypothetical protein
MPEKPWDEMDLDEKCESLRRYIQDFISFYNNSVLARNTARDQIIARLDSLEAAIKRLEVQLGNRSP